jgi:hypothetical protein
MNQNYKAYKLRKEELETELLDINYKIRAIQSTCRHEKLPRRAFAELYCDTCPDCGYNAYSYCMG